MRPSNARVYQFRHPRENNLNFNPTREQQRVYSTKLYCLGATYLLGVAGADAGMATLSSTEDARCLLEAMVKAIEVHIITIASAAVNLLMALKAVGLANKLSAPEAPKMPAAEPLPLCNKTIKINNTHAMK